MNDKDIQIINGIKIETYAKNYINLIDVKTGMSQATLAKLSKGENVTTDVLERICKVLNCEIGDIVEIKEEEQK